MKMARKFDSLRSKLQRMSQPFNETTNIETSSCQTRRDSTSPTSSPPSRGIRKRTDSDSTIVPIATQRPASEASQHNGSPRPTKRRRETPPDSSPQTAVEPDYPEIPDEEPFSLPPIATQWKTDPLRIPSPPVRVQVDSDSDDSSIALSKPTSPLPQAPQSALFGHPIGLVSSFPPRRTLSSILDLRLASHNPVVWDLGLSSSADDSFVITIQLRFRSWDLRGFDKEPPKELFMRVASTSYPRFRVSESRRAYQVKYIRSPLHPNRTLSDTKDLCKLKGWRFKHGCWVFDMAWKVNASLFSENLPTRKFTLQAEIKICDAIVTSGEKCIHITNFMTSREMGGLVPTAERLRAEYTF